MNEESKRISLKGGSFYVTERASDAFKVIEGSILIYIVPLKETGIGRRSFIYQAYENEVFPSFAYKDIEYCQWRFCLVAVDEAIVEIIDNGATKRLKQRFAEKAKIKNYEHEGYEGGLVDQYRINTVTEDGFIRRSQHERAETVANTLKLILNAFKKSRYVFESDQSNVPLYNAMSVLCSQQRIQIAPFEKMKEACGENMTVSDIARISHFSYREVILESGWHHRDSGAFLVFDEKKNPMVCLPKGSGSYILYNTESNSGVPVTSKVAQTISPNAYMIYRPLPLKKLNLKDIITFCVNGLRTFDVVLLAVLSIATSLIGLLTPTISQMIYDEYIPLGAKSLLFQLGCLMGSFMISNIMFSVVKNLTSFRITSKLAYDMQGAVYDRTFNLPESFFREFESAELGQYLMGVGGVVNTFCSIVITSIISLVFLIVYFCRMASYSMKLTLIALLMILVYSAVYYLISSYALGFQEKVVELEGKTNSLMFQFITGISKIRIAGVEDRALYEYLKPYVKLRNNEAKKNTVENIGQVIALAANSIFSMILYFVIIKGNMDISLGAFVAFSTVFGAFAAYALQIVQGLVNAKSTLPTINKLKPIFEAEPEFDDAKELPGDISGSIEINNVTFAYSDDSPNVLENISLDIKPGEYVGLVGPSGCGKSTLMKLLLGFEKPTSGKIYYDNKDIESVDKRELRKKMGVVLQDGKLISGSIFENITITAPKARLADVNAVIKAVGLESDIKDMPMGLHTVLSEDCGTISGGQQQRILIARAIISNPNILFFDEATSALDNVTQRMVCDTIEKMDSTRIVIAHRLSTIINCDRIIVLNRGRIEEQGTYEELMENEGLFYQLASRQMA